MSSAATAISAGGTILSAIGQMRAGQAAADQGRAQQVASNYSGAVADQQAGQTMAVTSAGVTDTKTKTDYLLSKARAIAAASGGGATDPTVQTIEGRIAARGEYDMLSQLYTGGEKAAGLSNQADLYRYTGTQQAAAGESKKTAAYSTALGSLISSGSSLYAKYGMPAGGGTAGSGSAFGGVASDASNPLTYG